MTRAPMTPEEARRAADRAEARARGADPFAEPTAETKRKRKRTAKPKPGAETVEAEVEQGVSDGEDALEALCAAARELDAYTIRQGRPSKYQPEFAEQAEKLCKLGATDAELADFFDVAVRTISYWAVAHPEFLHALKAGKEVADARVERSLFQRAVGFEMDAVKIISSKGVGSMPQVVRYRERVAPDTTACIFWLKNRKKDEWRDKQELEHSGEVGFKALWAEMANRGKAKAHDPSTGAPASP